MTTTVKYKLKKKLLHTCFIIQSQSNGQEGLFDSNLDLCCAIQTLKVTVTKSS